MKVGNLAAHRDLQRTHDPWSDVVLSASPSAEYASPGENSAHAIYKHMHNALLVLPIRPKLPGSAWHSRCLNYRSAMRVPILKQGDYVIASIQSALTDEDLVQLRDGLASHVGRYRSKGVIVDVTVLDVMDSFATRTVRDLAQMVRLRGAQTVIVGIQPEVAFAMVQLGLELGDVATALDLEEALELLRHGRR